MELKFVKSVGKSGYIGFRVYVNGSEDEIKLLEKAWGRLETETVEGYAVELSDGTCIHRCKSTDEKAFTYIYAIKSQDDIVETDITKEHIDELVNLLKNEIDLLRKEEEYTYYL